MSKSKTSQAILGLKEELTQKRNFYIQRREKTDPVNDGTTWGEYDGAIVALYDAIKGLERLLK